MKENICDQWINEKNPYMCVIYKVSCMIQYISFICIHMCTSTYSPHSLILHFIYIASKCQGGLAYCWLVLITLIYKYADCVATLFICAKIEYCYISNNDVDAWL